MSELRMISRITFDPKDFDEVAQICEAMVSTTRNDSGVLEYSYWVSEAHDTVYIREHYESDDALLAHLGNMDQEVVGRLLAVAELGKVEIAAKPTPKVEEALAGFGVPVAFYEPLLSL